MSNYTITKNSPLNGVKRILGDITIAEITDQSLVMIAMPHDKSDEISTAINKSCGLSIPSIGSSTFATGITLWRLQNNQMMAYFAYAEDDAEAYIKTKFNATSAYYTDQSDTWVMINIKGTEVRKVLERICPLNLDANVFAIGTVARTVMEHLGTIIFRDGENSFVLLVMRSFAQSMLHALEISVQNTRN